MRPIPWRRATFVAVAAVLIACGVLVPAPGELPEAHRSPYPTRDQQRSRVTQTGQHIAEQLAATIPGATASGPQTYDGGDCSPAAEYGAAHGAETVGIWQVLLPPGVRRDQLAPARRQLAASYTLYATPHPRDLMGGHDPVYDLDIAVFEVQTAQRQEPGQVTIEVRGRCYPLDPAP